MAANSLEDLLQEALADFEDTPAALDERELSQKPNSSPAAPAADTLVPSDDAKRPGGVPAPTAPKPAPKGLGLGLGSAKAFGPRPRKPAGATASLAASEPKAEDGFRSSLAEAEGGAHSSSDTGGAGSGGGAKPGRKLPAEAQRLADDLINLLQEAGLGEGSGQSDQDALKACLADLMAAGDSDAGPAPSGSPPARQAAVPAAGIDSEDPFARLFGGMLRDLAQPGPAAGGADDGPPPEFAALLQQMMMGGPGVAGPGAGGFGAGLDTAVGAAGDRRAGGPGPSGAADGDDDALSSTRLAGLAQRTRKTVSEQAKKTRGHVEGGAAARPAGLGGGLGGMPFGHQGFPGGFPGGLGLLKDLGGLGLGGPDGGGEGGAGVNMMVDYIMRNLLSKDVLYTPLKEIRDRYPPWLEANQGTLPPEEYKRYVGQYESVQRVCVHYETAPSDFGKLMELIQEMQTYGDPPGDIVEEMTGGASRDLNNLLAAADGIGAGQEGSQPALEELTKELDKCKIQ